MCDPLLSVPFSRKVEVLPKFNTPVRLHKGEIGRKRKGRGADTTGVEERRENAADQVVAALQRALQTAEIDLVQLRAPARGDDALTVEFRPSSVRAYPNGSLYFDTSPSAPQEALASVYQEAEAFEFQRQDYEKALSALAALTRSTDRTIRAGGYPRIVRIRRKAGQYDAALRTYAELGTYGETSTGGLPAGLVARRGRCVLLAQLGRGAVAAVTQVAPDLMVRVRTMGSYIDDTMVTERLKAMLSGLFGILALLLAAVGVYGVVAYAVAQRRSEIGIRLALGASPASVLRTVLRRVALLVGAGMSIGAVISFWASRIVAAMLIGLQPRDPATFASAAIVLISVAAVAGCQPARRASQIDPATVLHSE